jgi:hypothetical protein
VRGFTESAYRWVAEHRGLLGRLTRWLYGRDAARQPFALAHHLGLRGLGLVYLVAFLSFWVQADGLIGARGILPFGAWLEAIRPQVAAVGYDRLPTLLWLWPTDAGLHTLCAAGVAAAVLLLLGRRTRRVGLVAVGALSFPYGRGPDLHGFPVGKSFAGRRTAGRPVCAVAHATALGAGSRPAAVCRFSVPCPGVQTDVPVWAGSSWPAAMHRGTASPP